MVERLVYSDVGAAFVKGDDEFDFMVYVFGADRVANRRTVIDQRICGLHEEERWLAIRVVAHFTRMVGVVAAHAVDTPNGKALVAARNGDRRMRADVDGERSHFQIRNEGLMAAEQ